MTERRRGSIVPVGPRSRLTRAYFLYRGPFSKNAPELFSITGPPPNGAGENDLPFLGLEVTQKFHVF